jgi:hypothetical protein
MPIGWRACARPDGRVDARAASNPGRPQGSGGALSILEAAAMSRDKQAVGEARVTLLRLRLDFSQAWMSKNNPHAGDMLERVLRGLRRPRVPED